MTDDASEIKKSDFRSRIKCEKNVKPGPKKVKRVYNYSNKEKLFEFYEYCNMRIEEREEDFILAKRQIAEILEQMLREGKINSNVKLLSRIKSPESIVSKLLLVIKADKERKSNKCDYINPQKSKRNKIKAYDVFGVAILADTQEEIDRIEEEFKRRFDVTSVRHRNEEKRVYKATHMEFLVGEKDIKTIIEFHGQTFRGYKDCYPHEYYKIRRKLNEGKPKEQRRELTPEEEKEIREIIQRKYETGELEGISLSNGKKSKLPQMYEANFNGDGKMVEIEWGLERILQELYPFLQIKPAEEPKHNQPSITRNLQEDMTL